MILSMRDFTRTRYYFNHYTGKLHHRILGKEYTIDGRGRI